jgi:hypothetical protein
MFLVTSSLLPWLMIAGRDLAPTTRFRLELAKGFEPLTL